MLVVDSFEIHIRTVMLTIVAYLYSAEVLLFKRHHSAEAHAIVGSGCRFHNAADNKV